MDAIAVGIGIGIGITVSGALIGTLAGLLWWAHEGRDEGLRKR